MHSRPIERSKVLCILRCSLILTILSGMEKHVQEPLPISTVDD